MEPSSGRREGVRLHLCTIWMQNTVRYTRWRASISIVYCHRLLYWTPTFNAQNVLRMLTSRLMSIIAFLGVLNEKAHCGTTTLRQNYHDLYSILVAFALLTATESLSGIFPVGKHSLHKSQVFGVCLQLSLFLIKPLHRHGKTLYLLVRHSVAGSIDQSILPWMPLVQHVSSQTNV